MAGANFNLKENTTGTGSSSTTVQGTAAVGAAVSGNPVRVGGSYNTTPTTLSNGQQGQLQQDTAQNLLVSLNTLISGEDQAQNVLKTEQRFSYTEVTADAAIKSGAGFLHSISLGQDDAAPTAGSLIVYDNTAESGTVIYKHTFTTTTFNPTTVILDVSFSTGCYAGFTTTGDVAVTFSYR